MTPSLAEAVMIASQAQEDHSVVQDRAVCQFKISITRILKTVVHFEKIKVDDVGNITFAYISFKKKVRERYLQKMKEVAGWSGHVVAQKNHRNKNRNEFTFTRPQKFIEENR
ncbi:MAG: hypothetical protein WBG71_00015 [Leeuwenhoekiella sp.]